MDAPLPAARPPTSLFAAVVLVLLAWALCAAPGLLASPVKNAAQARAWSVARTMARGGDWAIPSYQGEPRLKKPPLQSWVQAAAMTAAGDVSVRVAGFASWLVGCLWALGPLLLGAGLARPTAGLLGSLALASSRAAEAYGASPEHDVPFGAFVVLALAFLARSLGPRARARDAWIAGLASGAALLVKGPFALAFVLGTAAVVAWTRRRDVGAPRVRWVPLLVGTFLPAVLWLAVVAQRLGSVSSVFDEMRRQALGEGGAHVRSGIGGVLYFLGVVPALALPWAALGLAAGAFLLLRRSRAGALAPGAREPGSLAFAAVAFVAGLVTLTVVPAKQEHYALPILPAGFLLLGALLEGALARGAPRLARFAPAILAGTGIAFGLSRVVSATKVVGFVAPPVALLAGAAAAVGVAAVVTARSPGRAVALGFLVAAAFAGWGAHADAVRATAGDDYRHAVATAFPRGVGFDDRPVVGLAAGEGEAFDAVGVWIDRPVRRERTAEAVAARIGRGERFLLLVPEGDAEGEDLVKRAPAIGSPAVLAPERPKATRDRIRVFVVG